ncbi:MAG: nitrilase-related carbon-nitrogen hydrolase, partial [Cereibacter sp.]
TEPSDPGPDSAPHWDMVMRGHAAATILPVIASNRIVAETAPEGTAVTFYGSSFIADQTGQLVAKAARDGEEVLTARFDLDAIAALRRSWGLFRDRRPDTYRALGTLDGIL